MERGETKDSLSPQQKALHMCMLVSNPPNKGEMDLERDEEGVKKEWFSS